ncbi:MAG: helix-turn-helix domain-containing protein [Thermoplasmata archaeon]
MDRLEVGGGNTLIEVRLISPDGVGWGEELGHLPRVQELECLDSTPGSETYRILIHGPSFIPLLKKLKLLRHFPFPIQNGIAAWTIVGPTSKVRALLTNLASSRAHFEVEAIHHQSLARPPSSLTPRQQEVLARALAEGYFDVPRRITLTQLAPRIGVAMSTLSVTLAVIEKKVLEART